jgi:predicted PurR-regulated permease PerM
MDFAKIRNYLFLGLLLIVTVGFLSTVKVFAYPIFWAMVIAAIFYPAYNWMNKKLKHPDLSSTITLVAVFLVIVIPFSVIGTLVIKQSVDLYTSINGNRGQIIQTVQNATHWIKNNPLTKQLNFDDSFWIEKFSQLTQKVTTFLIDSATSFTQDSVTFVVMFIIMFYTLFFFLRDGEKFLRKLMHLCPLGDRYEQKLYDRFTSTARATIKGNLILGAIQGGLGVLLFSLTGVPGALIWGIIMMLFCIIPGLGSFIVWFPTGLITLLAGNTWQGITILLVGALLISTIDNFLRPILVGRDIQMHPLLVLFSTLGGIVVFGASGFIIGPIIAALFMAFWDMYEEYYRDELNHN